MIDCVIVATGAILVTATTAQRATGQAKPQILVQVTALALCQGHLRNINPQILYERLCTRALLDLMLPGLHLALLLCGVRANDLIDDALGVFSRW